MNERQDEYKEALIKRLQASKGLNGEAGRALIDWVDTIFIQGESIDQVDGAIAEVSRIAASERANRQIDYNLRQRFGSKLDHLTYRKLVEEYSGYATSDFFGNNDGRFLEWLGIEED